MITFLWQLKGRHWPLWGKSKKQNSLLHGALENAESQGERFLLWQIHAIRGRLYHSCIVRMKPGGNFRRRGELIEELSATVPDEALKANFLRGANNMLDLR